MQLGFGSFEKFSPNILKHGARTLVLLPDEHSPCAFSYSFFIARRIKHKFALYYHLETHCFESSRLVAGKRKVIAAIRGFSRRFFF